VDGREVPRVWLTVGPYTGQDWQDSDYEIPADFTRGKNKLRIQVQALDHPPVKTPDIPKEINEFHYWIFSHLTKTTD
jgi:hypothetical protein